MANDWADGSDLASMSRSGNVLQQLGYDPDEVRTNPGMRAELMQKLGSPMQQPPVQMAQNAPPPMPGRPNPATSLDPSSYLQRRPAPAPAAPAQPLPSTLPTPQSMATGAPPTSSSVSPSGTPTPSNVVDIENARKAAGNLLAPEPTAPDTTAIDQTISQESIPHNPQGAKYHEGVLGRVGRGFQAAAEGFARGGVPASIGGAVEPAAVGSTPYGAPNRKYAPDEAVRQAQLADSQKQRQAMMDKFKQQTDLRKQADTGAKDAGDMANNTAEMLHKTTTANADMLRSRQAGDPKNEQEALSKAYTTEDPTEAAKYFAMAKAMHSATMEEKPPKAPGEHPSAALVEYSDRKAAMQHENGGKPLSSAQLASLAGPTSKGMPTKAGFEGLLKERDRDYQTQQKNYDGIRAAADKLEDPGEKAQAIAKADADNNNKLNDLQTGWNNRLADYDPDGSLSHAATPAPAAPAAPAAPNPPRMNEVRKGYRYTGGDPASPTSWAKVRK